MGKTISYQNEVIAGLLSGIVIITVSTAFTALIFKGAILAPYFSIGLACTLMAAIITNLITARFSSFPSAIARPEAIAGTVLAVGLAYIANLHLASGSLLPTLLVTISLASLLIGIIQLLLGYFNLGQIIRFLPYPVLSGIITGSGWIMMKAGISVIVSDQILSFSHLSPQVIIALLTTFVIFFLSHRGNRLWLLPISIIIISFVVNLFLYYMGFSHLDAIHEGWLFSFVQPKLFLSSLHLEQLHQVNWFAVISQAGYFATIIAITTIQLLLNVSGLETLRDTDADLEKELKVSGLANLVNGLFMSMPCSLSLTGTLLNQDLGATRRISGFTASVTVLVLVVFFPDILSYLPKPLIAGILLYMSITVLYEGLYRGFQILPRVDYFIVVVILITIALWGLLQGMVVGILMTCLVFIINYSRSKIIRFSASGQYYHSTVTRPAEQQAWLVENGHEMYLFKLQGAIFFGSANLLYKKVLELTSDEKYHIKFIIFDFQLITSIDSSAIFSFLKIQRLIGKKRHNYSLHVARLIYSKISSSNGLMQNFLTACIFLQISMMALNGVKTNY